MPNNADARLIEKTAKTGFLVSLALLVPRCFFGSNEPLGNVLGLLSACLMVGYLHDLGKRRRPGGNLRANITANVHGLFHHAMEADLTTMKNALRNVINGGDALADTLVEKLDELLENADIEAKEPRPMNRRRRD